MTGRPSRRTAAIGRGFFAVGVYRPKTAQNIGTLWRSAHVYGAAYIFTVGCRYGRRQASDTTKAAWSIPLIDYPDLQAFQDARPQDTPLVGVEMDDRAVLLNDYAHPVRAVYLLGAEDDGLPPDVLSLCDAVVQVETLEPWSLNVATAGSIVLRDRHVQARRTRRAVSA